MFRTKNGFIYFGEAKVGDVFKYMSQSKSEEEDPVVCVGPRLKDLLMPGDLLSYAWGEEKDEYSHGMWLFPITEENVDAIKSYSDLVIRHVFVPWGNMWMESIPYSYEFSRREFWALGEKEK